MNKPVVATNHGGVKDIIENVNGFFFEIRDDKELANNILKSKTLKFDGRPQGAFNDLPGQSTFRDGLRGGGPARGQQPAHPRDGPR